MNRRQPTPPLTRHPSQEGRRRGNRVKKAIRRKNTTHCYLCGHPLSPPDNSDDHCPPRALFAPEIRKRNLSQLITIPVHKDCNAFYSSDEEYFIATMVPFAPGSEAGDAVFKKSIEDYWNNKAGRKRQLPEKVLRQFETRPSGLHLPEGRVIMRIEGIRVARVAWKIVRGLYFHHHNTILPEDIYFDFTVTPPNERPPDLFIDVIGLPDNEKHGQYPGIFDYLFRVLEADFGKKLHYWAFLIWDRIIMTVSFHDPWSCKCENCISALRIWNQRALQPRIPNSTRSRRYVR